MNWSVLIVLVLCVGFGVAIPWALRADRADYAEFHLMHGPQSGCLECADK
ncbi:hypothetical protein AHiyo6_04020 [Arthrobacter sp. Hiyo6]|nr:hypothetical protein AHiyo6_04020 [Arthrobacter sp. Hiyo6]